MTTSVQYANVTGHRKHGNPRQQLTVGGYTKRGGSPTVYQVQIDNESRWRRVYALCFSNAGSLIIKTKGGILFVHDYQITK